VVRVKAQGKWIDDLEADTPLVDAARAFLSLRLGSVVELLPATVEAEPDDHEYVHQLRVATRRSDAAISVFTPCLRPKRSVKVRRQLKRIRRAAGLARICDVHGMIFAALADQAPAAYQGALHFAIEQNQLERLQAQGAIASVAQRYAPPKFRRSVERLLDHIAPPVEEPGCTLIDASRVALPGLIEHVRIAAGADLHDLTNMHELRIMGKRLRYAMEIFAPCYQPEMREHYYPLVEQMQEHLGNVNDTHEIIARLASWAGLLQDNGVPATDRAGNQEIRDELLALVEVYRAQLDEQRRQFLAFWKSFGVTRLVKDLRQLLHPEVAH
jgi:CHAD domain-containing protein